MGHPCTLCPFRKGTTTKIVRFDDFATLLKSGSMACLQDLEASCPELDQDQSPASPSPLFRDLDEMRLWHASLPVAKSGTAWELFQLLDCGQTLSIPDSPTRTA